MSLRYLAATAVLVASSVVDGAAVPGPPPNQLIEQVAGELLEALNGNREQLAQNPDELRGVIDGILLPHFDTGYAARFILAKHWTAATEEQRDRFRNALYASILGTYATGLLDFTADKLTVLPFRGDLEKKNVKVRTEITLDNGTDVPVNYRLRKTKNGWKVWDVEIEGISYARTYRNDFDAEINAKGIEAVIVRLETEGEAAPGDEGRTVQAGE